MRRSKAKPKLIRSPDYNREPVYNKEGVDLSYIRWFLEKTPAERLQIAQNFTQDVLRIRALNAGR
jgi:hypothetical protein